MGLYNVSIALFFCLELIIFLSAIIFKKKKVLIYFFLILIAFIYATMIKIKYDNAFKQNEKLYVLKIESLKEEVKNYNKYIARVKTGRYKNLKVYVYTKQELPYGSIIKCFEKIEKPDTIRNDKRF